MTIQEAINHAKKVASKKYIEGFLCYANSGVVENDKKNDECVECAKEHEQLAEWLEELQKYREIGTVDKCYKAVEKQTEKSPIVEEGFYVCPNCGRRFSVTGLSSFCYSCGQAINWKYQISMLAALSRKE